MKNICLFLLCMCISMCSFGAEFVGKIQSIAVGPSFGSLVLVRVEGQSTAADWSAQCSTHSFWSFKFDPNVAGGKETYSMLLAAYASKSSVVISGTGTCASGDNINNVQNLYYTRFAF